MRITNQQHEAIKRVVNEMFGEEAVVILFGSRADDDQRGGDLDLMIESQTAIDNPAWVAANCSVKLSRLLSGRNVDVLLSAPNLAHLPIHEQAKLNGIKL